MDARLGGGREGLQKHKWCGVCVEPCALPAAWEARLGAAMECA